MNWSKSERSIFLASQQKISIEVTHIGNAQNNCHRVHRNNTRLVPGNVGELPPLDPIKRDPGHKPIHVAKPETGLFKTSGLPNGGGETPQSFQARRAARRRKRV